MTCRDFMQREVVPTWAAEAVAPEATCQAVLAEFTASQGNGGGYAARCCARETAVLCHLYGIGVPAKSAPEVAALVTNARTGRLGISPTRVKELRAEGLNRLRHPRWLAKLVRPAEPQKETP